jgi:hypothetical protein
VPAAATLVQLREAFGHWGIPRCVRVDNGWPWGSTGELPTDLAMWLIGLGVEVICDHPHEKWALGRVGMIQPPRRSPMARTTSNDEFKIAAAKLVREQGYNMSGDKNVTTATPARPASRQPAQQETPHPIG